MSKTEAGFGKLRSFFWPIYRSELVKFIPMMVLFFLISFNYHLLKILKEPLIVTAANSGTEVIPFLKVWCMLPGALIFMYIFTRLSNRFNYEKVFYIVTSIFLIFFILFIFVIYPYRNFFYLDSFADYLQRILPIGFKGFVAMIRYWMFSMFYVMAELWSTIMVSILLWGFANDVTSITEAKRFYPFFGIGINSSGILAGKFSSYLISNKEISAFDKGLYNVFKYLNINTTWDLIFIKFIFIILLFGICTIFIYRWLHVSVFKQRVKTNFYNIKKNKLSIRKTISYILKSKYLIRIALIVLSYNVVINLTEILWKSQVKELYPSASEYTYFMSQITIFIGVFATLGSYFISGNMIRLLGWKSTALVTPIILGGTTIVFFACLFIRCFNLNAIILGFPILFLTVFFGSFQNILARAAKYTVFDDSKEIAFIPLNQEAKIKGKAAIDGIGSRLGKSGSSFVFQTLLMIFSSSIFCSYTVFLLILFIMPTWFLSINSLNKKFKVLSIDKVNEINTKKAVNLKIANKKAALFNS